MAALVVSGALTSCIGDLDFESAAETNDPDINQPFDPNQMYTKCYASLIMEGNDGSADFDIDEEARVACCATSIIWNAWVPMSRFAGGPTVDW